MSPTACGSKPVSATGNATRSTLSVSAADTGADANAAISAKAHAAASVFTAGVLQQLLDVGHDGLGLGLRRIAFDDVPLAVDEELGEVPLDRLGAEQAGLFLLQVLVKRRGGPAVDVDLREHRKRDAVIDFAERLDVLLASRLLRTELIARKAEHGEPFVGEPLVQRFETFVLGRVTALARGVDDQHHLALVAVEVDRLAVDVLDAEIVDARHCAAPSNRTDHYAPGLLRRR